MRLFITGAAGFIGSNFIRYVLDNSDDEITVYDALTYAGTKTNFTDIEDNPRFTFIHGDICDRSTVSSSIGNSSGGNASFVLKNNLFYSTLNSLLVPKLNPYS